MTMLGFFTSRFSHPSLLLLLLVVCPAFWPLLFFTWPFIVFFVVSDKFLLNPDIIHTNKNLLREMNLFKKCTSARARSRTPSNQPHHKPAVTRNPMIVAHRCGSGEFPENTIAAARNSLRNTPPSTLLHVDLHLTGDMEVVCFRDQEPHERNMLKMTGR